MPRALRVHVPGGFYHVTIRGNHQQRVFIEEGDQRLLNLIVSRALQDFGARLHAYCWMTNHLHLLMQVQDVPLSNPMRNIASEFARAMQRKLETTGHFFERRYHASLVDTDAYLLELIRYTHLNPVRAGIVAQPALYPWSSHHAYVGARDEPWVTTDFALQMFAADRHKAISAYLRFLDESEAEGWAPELIDLTPMRGVSAATRLESAVDPPGRKATLDQLIDEACLRFTVTVDLLRSPARDRRVSKVRAWIARQAIGRGICRLSAIARKLNRTEATLRSAMRSHTDTNV